MGKHRNDVHVVSTVNVNGRSTTHVWQSDSNDDNDSNDKEHAMTDETKGLTDEELAGETGEELPDREAMSLINANLAAPVNAAVALNVASDNSVAYANAVQDVDITQST